MVAVVALICLAQSQSSLMGQVIPNPSGQNGYEEYLRAADIISGETANALLAGPLRDGEDTTVTNESTNKEYRRVRASLAGLSKLEVERLLWAKFGRAMDLVEKGNQKPVIGPRPTIGPSTLFPEMARFRSIARLAVAGSHVLLAQGNPRAASHQLINCLELSANIQKQILIANLVGMAMEAIVTAAIDADLQRFSEADWRDIDSEIEKLQSRPSPIKDVLAGEFQMAETTLKELLANPTPEDLDSLVEGLGKQNSNQIQRVVQLVLDGLRRDHTALETALQGPETTWHFEPQRFGDKVVDGLLNAVEPTYSGLISSTQKVYTQRRLLRLHARIQRYRWHTGNLPTKLEDITNDITDPLSGEAFVYIPGVRGNYELYSKGAGTLGRIDLKYTRPTESQTGDTPQP